MLTSIFIILCLFHHPIIASNAISGKEDKKQLGTRMYFFYISLNLVFQGFQQAIKDAIEKIDHLAISTYFLFYRIS